VTAVFDPTVEPAPGDRMQVSVGREHVYLFDLKTGEAL
jgi:hypothetical protein